MQIDDLIKLLSVLKNNDQKCEAAHEAIGHTCIIRTYASGVHYGTIASVHENGGRSRIKLCNARRIWSWKGAFSLSELSQNGLNSKESRISCCVPFIFIEDVIEIIPLSEKALISLNETEDYEC